MKHGWVSVHRQIQEHWVWEEKPFSKGQAWIDLLLMANHEDTKFLLGNQLIHAKRGEVITSEVKLMERWGWGKTKLRAFLELLQNDLMIIKKTDRKKTTITLTNYCVWQDLKTTKEPQTDRKQTVNKPQADTINNYNNYNNNKDIVPFAEIIDHLNQKCKTKYRVTTKATKRHIQARWKEGFRLEDFKAVIDKKAAEWLTNPKMLPYLRPETLFGNKFESYLNYNAGEVETSEIHKQSKYAMLINREIPEPEYDPTIF